jgi:hypothetical protein
MRFLVAAALFVAACASQPSDGAGQSQRTSTPTYRDARSTASDAEVRAARRAYRAACEQQASTARCECLTGGMAQSLAPVELNVATGALSGHPVSATDEAQARIAAAQSAAEHACTAYPR